MVNSWLSLLFLWLFTYPFISLCQQGEGKKCSANLPCDRKVGLHCSPKPEGICQECGVNNRQNHFDTRIVGGRPTDPKAWPWMAGVTKKFSKDFPFCGGTLITDRHVLTAAHCIVHFTPVDLMVRLGEYDFSKVGDNNPVDFEVEKIDIHERYDNDNTDNDIAVLTLQTEVKFNEFIWPACLPSPNMKIENQIGLVAGWGTKYFEGPTNSVLHEAAVKVWKRSDCTQAYADREITDNMMCCGWAFGKVDSCHGDSGGPLAVQILGSKKWFLIGIVSWGRGCASPNLPGVYAIVSNYLDWIETHTKPGSEQTPAKEPIRGSDCSNGYEVLKGVPKWCVKVNTNTINWWQAAEACVTEGGTLAIADSKEKQEAISNMMKERNIADLWFGLSDTNEEGKFKWIDGSLFSSQPSSSWGLNQPDGGDEFEDCVHFSSSWEYKWNDVTCHALFPYLCEQKTQTSCPAGWISGSSTCFHIGDKELNYDASVAYCAGKGGSLAVITNAADMTFARELLNRNNVKLGWIGLRLGKNGAFKWIDGTPLQYQSWTTNQPDNYLGMEGCVSMDKFYSYLWNDDGCQKLMQPFCSRSASA